MRWNTILTIFRKDVLDAIKDARVLVALLVPLGLGILYGQLFEDEAPRVSVDIAYAASEMTTLPDAIQQVAGEAVDLTFTQLDSPDAVRQEVDEKQADLGLVIPAGFDAAVAQGEAPPLTVIRRAGSGFGADFASTALDGALRAMAGQHPPATITPEVLATEPSDAMAIFEELGMRRYFILAVVVMMVVMIGMLVVPVILAEETEKKTLDALVMIASYGEVVTAKALVGLVYVVLSVAVLMGITQLIPENMLLFIAGTLVLGITMIAFGLFVGGFFKSANQLNTWSGIILLPVAAPAFLVGLGLPRAADIALQLLPTSRAAKVLINGLSGKAYFADVWFSFVVMLAWAALAYLLVVRSLQRREV